MISRRRKYPQSQPQVATIQEVLVLTSYILSVITPFSTELLTEPKKPVPATGSYYSRKHWYLPVTWCKIESQKKLAFIPFCEMSWNPELDILCAVSTPQREMSLRTPCLREYQILGAKMVFLFGWNERPPWSEPHMLAANGVHSWSFGITSSSTMHVCGKTPRVLLSLKVTTRQLM